MKNISVSILVAASLALVSCGTSTYSANGGGGYMNSIYYASSDAVPGASEEVGTTSYTTVSTSAQDASKLKSRTVAVLNTNNNVFTQSAYTDTIFVGDENIVNVEYNPQTTYVIADDDESYEARLRKFDSPTYTVNVVVDPWDLAWYNPFAWNWNYHYYRYRYGYHSAIWWNDWWNWRWGWNDPWYYGWSWYDRYWYSWNWSWHDPWYYGGWHRPYYSHWGGGRDRHHHNRPGVYYTRRGGVGSRGSNMGRATGIAHRSGNDHRAVGSSYRRTPTIGNVRGGSNRPAISRSNPSGRGNVTPNRNANGRRNVAPGRNAAVSRHSSSGRDASMSRSNGGVRYGTPSRGNAVSTRSGGSHNGSYRNGNSSSYRNTGTSSRHPAVSSRSGGNSGSVYRQSSTPARKATSSSRPGNTVRYSSGSSGRGNYSRSSGSSSSSRSSGSYSSGGSSRSSGSYSSGGGSRSSGSSHSSGGGRSGGSSTRR